MRWKVEAASPWPVHRGRRMAMLALLVPMVLAACGPAAPTGSGGQPGSSPSRERVSRTMVIAVRYEPQSLAVVPLRETGSGVSSTTRLFNAGLDLKDGNSQAHPYLAEALPRLNTDSWRVFPDGRMETTYRLRENATWHDGAPLSAEDFAFAWSVYSNPTFGLSEGPPLKQMEDVMAPDPRTVVIRWRETYPDASALENGFQALPRHVLADQYTRLDAEAFIALPFWTSAYVGLGPYAVQRLEPGALIEGAAFDGHVLGRPKIDRIVVRFFADENVAYTNVLAGEVHLATGRSLRFEHGSALKREWSIDRKGTVLFAPDTSRFVASQFRPDLVAPRDLLDPRVRKALVSSIDRDALNTVLFEGDGEMSDIFLTRFSRYERVPDMDRALAEAQRSVAHYPFDERQTAAYMASAGYAKGRDGVYTSAGGERFSLEVWNHASPQYEKELAIMVDTWNKVGFEARPHVLSAAALRDGQLRSSFPGLYIASSGRLQSFTQVSIPSPANRWSGSNRGGWANQEYEVLWTAFNSTLDPDQRRGQLVGMLKLLNEELPAWVIYFNSSVSAHVASIKGPTNGGLDTDIWNVHEWEMS